MGKITSKLSAESTTTVPGEIREYVDNFDAADLLLPSSPGRPMVGRGTTSGW